MISEELRDVARLTVLTAVVILFDCVETEECKIKMG